mmetsp:Transcript_14746/g.26669  ORF Transcript_14746/g.26669 Transcript_14746/m.26669 type:complete len:553 (-) Transcript_14746:307-1965(-)
MSRKVSKRWKRRVGSRHWTEDEDEFVRYVPPDDVNDDVFAVLVNETERDPSTTIFMKRVLFLGLPSILVAVVLLFVEKKRRKIPTSESTQCRRRRKQTRADTTTTITTKRCYETEVETCDDFELVIQDEGTKADAIVVEDDKKVQFSALCLDSKSDTDFTLPVNEIQESHQHGTLVNTTVNTDTLLPPGLVVEEVGAPAANKTTTCSCPVLSDSLELTVADNNNNKSSCSFDSLSLLPSKKTEQGMIKPATLIQDAQIVAQSIRLAQAVFEQHGLDSRIATEWAMRRQESELSETSRQRHEDRKLYMETIQRHEDRIVSERQFHNMKASIEYDNDWLSKIYRARDKCTQACLQTLMLSIVIMLVAEVYFSLPPDTSTVALISLLLGCKCSGTDTDISTDLTGWSLAWFSDYCTAPLVPSFRTSLCYAKCISWCLLPPFCVQVVLNFCNCPSLIHQGVTVLTIASLLSPQLEIAVSRFAWYRLLPIVMVTIACVSRIWIRSSFYIARLQRANANMRKELEESFISLDSIQYHVMLVHLCAVGILLALSLELSF